MKIALLCIAIATLFLAACAPVTSILESGSMTYAPVAPENVKFYMNGKALPESYEELGLVVSTSRYMIVCMIGLDYALTAGVPKPRNHEESKEMTALAKRVGDMGANGLLITDVQRVSTGISISGIAIRTK